MVNGNIPSWEEWNEQMSQEQRDYSLYKILENMNSKLNHCPVQLAECDKRFKTIEDRKWFHAAASAVGGVIGGISAVIGKWFFFSGSQ